MQLGVLFFDSDVEFFTCLTFHLDQIKTGISDCSAMAITKGFGSCVGRHQPDARELSG